MSTPSPRLSSFALALAALLALACGGGGGDTPPPVTEPNPPPAAPETPPAQPPPTTGPIDFVQYARTLIEQDTSDSAKPREFAGLTFTDTEDPGAFLEDYFPQ